MQKKNRLINELIPADDLFWDNESKKYTTVSKEEEEQLFKACLNCRLEEEDAIKVFRCYEFFKTSAALFKQFLNGSVGIYSFTKNGNPLFEKAIKEEGQHIEFLLFKDKNLV